MFAVAALASIAAYLVSKGSIKTPPANSPAASLFAFVDTVSIILLMFWTLYVVTAAFSMTFWTSRGPFRILLGWFKGASQYFFSMGSVSSLLFAVYFILQFMYLALQSSDPTTLETLLVILILGGGSYVGLRLRQWRRQRVKGMSHVASPPSMTVSCSLFGLERSSGCPKSFGGLSRIVRQS